MTSQIMSLARRRAWARRSESYASYVGWSKAKSQVDVGAVELHPGLADLAVKIDDLLLPGRDGRPQEEPHDETPGGVQAPFRQDAGVLGGFELHLRRPLARVGLVDEPLQVAEPLAGERGDGGAPDLALARKKGTMRGRERLHRKRPSGDGARRRGGDDRFRPGGVGSVPVKPGAVGEAGPRQAEVQVGAARSDVDARPADTDHRADPAAAEVQPHAWEQRHALLKA
ncbi:hypothetical protein QSG27_09160 [Azospirillum sp. C340-1]|uniref:Uncharacterized protein n=1 Tax=Azospirillum isscasi TaxID=3053926 RepID=A0ABU0WF82_9PROT|nr:hypothetical protein [Azospirillum isscasi]MDQ2102858.1 hypothetical protein [Azospirillum isscasi]